MTPSLSVNYNSDAGNSWMGIGWNIGVPGVYLDTRWGVPRFDATKESELYSLFGEQLMYPDNFLPHRHRIDNDGNYTTEGQARNITSSNNPIKVFHPRRKETYAKIERIGYNPSEYYWKVTNMDGSISWFGGDENGLDTNYVTKSGTNNAFWALKKRVDTHGYFIKYEYQGGTTPTGNLAGGKHLYLKKIIYTGLQKLNGPTIQILKQPMYEVVFDLDSGTRQDKSISARYGYKDVIVNRLNVIRINELFNGSTNPVLIRKHVFTYGTGEFGKTVLRRVEEFKGNELVFNHKFGYVGALKSNMTFTESLATTPSSLDTDMLLGLDSYLKLSRLGTTENSGIGGELNVSGGAGISWQNMSANGTFLNIPMYDLKANFTSGKIAMVDIDGDGLQDILYKDPTGQLKYFENTCIGCKSEFKLIYNPAINVTYSSTAKKLEDVNHFLKGEGTQKAGLINGLFGFSMEYLFAKFGIKNYKSKSMLSHYMVDANGDLLPDFVVKQGENSLVYFNHLDAQGKRRFLPSSKPTENMLIVADVITPEGEAYDEYIEEDEPEMGYDAVKAIALGNTAGPIEGIIGSVKIDPNQLINNENIKVSIEKFDIRSESISQVFSGHLNSSNPIININIPASSFNNLLPGNKYIIYLRVHYHNQTNAKVDWNVELDYSYDISDGNGKYQNQFNTEGNFFLTNEGSYSIKATSTNANISWTSFNLSSSLSDDLKLRILKRTINQDGDVVNEEPIYNHQVNSGGAVIPAGNVMFSTDYIENMQTGEYTYTDVVCQLLSTSNLRWEDILWRPKLTYSGTTNMGGNTIQVNEEKYLVPYHSVFGIENYIGGNVEELETKYSIYRPYIHRTINSSSTISFNFINQNVITNSNSNGKIYLRIKKNNQLIAKRNITVSNGHLSIDNTASISLPASNINGSFLDNAYYITFSTNDGMDDNSADLLKEFFNDVIHNNMNIPFEFMFANLITIKKSSPTGPIYLGGGQFFYNSELASSTTPVDAQGDKLIDVNACNDTSDL